MAATRKEALCQPGSFAWAGWVLPMQNNICNVWRRILSNLDIFVKLKTKTKQSTSRQTFEAWFSYICKAKQKSGWKESMKTTWSLKRVWLHGLDGRRQHTTRVVLGLAKFSSMSQRPFTVFHWEYNWTLKYALGVCISLGTNMEESRCTERIYKSPNLEEYK